MSTPLMEIAGNPDMQNKPPGTTQNVSQTSGLLMEHKVYGPVVTQRFQFKFSGLLTDVMKLIVGNNVMWIIQKEP